MHKSTINQNLLYIRINFFCQFFVIAGFFAYLNPILSSCGLSAYQIGITSFLANTVGTISRLISGPLADGTKKKHLVLAGLSLCTAIFISQFAFLPTSIETVYIGSMDEDGKFRTRLEKLNKNNSNVVDESVGLDQPCWPITLGQCKFSSIDGKDLGVSGQFKLQGQSIDGLGAKYAPVSQLKTELLSRLNVMRLVCKTEGPSRVYPCSTIENRQRGTAYFWIVIIASVLRCLVFLTHPPIPNLLDSATYNILGEQNAHLYGRSRAFGSAGYVAGALVSGALISYFSPVTESNSPNVFGYTNLNNPVKNSNFMAPIILGTAAALAGTLVSAVPNKSHKITKTKLTTAILIGLRSPDMIKCIINSTLAGLIYSFFFEYFFFVLTGQYSVPPYFMGFIISVIVIGEIPAFMLSGLVMRRVGETTCICIAHLLFALRFLSFAYFENYWYYLITDSLFGTAFPFMYNALISQAGMAGRGARDDLGNVVNTMHALMNAILFGATACLGGFFWGLMLEYFTGRQLFYTVSLCAFSLCILTPLISKAIDKCFLNYEQKIKAINV